MRKIAYLLLSAVLMFSAIGLCACGESEGDNTSKETTASKNDEENVTTPSSNKEKETTTEADNKVTYKVTVVDEAGNAIEKAMVQLCKESCVPGVTDANGVAEFKLEEADYKVSLMTMPEGYAHTSDVEEFYFEEGKTELTITLKAQ